METLLAPANGAPGSAGTVVETVNRAVEGLTAPGAKPNVSELTKPVTETAASVIEPATDLTGSLGDTTAPLVEGLSRTLARLGFALGAYPWLGADALWLSFPVSSFANMVLAIAFYLHGGWRKGRMGPPPDPDECVEEAQAAGEPAGRLNPTG